MSEVTRILAESAADDRTVVLERLLPLVYDELRALARARLRHERPDHSLQPTALVHEAYLRLLAGARPSWNDRQHFFAAAAEAMRRILIDHARSRLRGKRGGGLRPLQLTEVEAAAEHDPETLLALDEAFRRLEAEDARAAEVVRLRLFAGLSVPETAQALDTSERTVKREWAFARAWLYAALTGPDAEVQP